MGLNEVERGNENVNKHFILFAKRTSCSAFSGIWFHWEVNREMIAEYFVKLNTHFRQESTFLI